MTARSFSILTRLGVPIALAILVASLVCAHGVPLLRHDWGLPQAPEALPAAWEVLFQPLLLRGFGESNPYPTTYLIGFVTMPLTALPPAPFMWLFVALITGSAAGGGAAIARAIGAGAAVEIGCGVFAALNPWMYTELVAGHVLMVMAYGFLLWLVSEVLHEKPRPVWLTLWSALVVCQIEFLTFAFIPMFVWLLYKRHYVAFAAMCVATLPIAFGIAAHYEGIRQTPFLLEWQIAESLNVLDALTFLGYFAGYAAAFNSIIPALWLLAAAAAAGTAIAVVRRQYGWPLLLLGWAAALLATGTKWIIAPLYTAAVLHVTEIGIFRELYDLLALSAIAYVVAMATIARTHRYAALALLAVSLGLVYPWLISPPFQHFVAQDRVPAQRLPGTDHERVALFPAQQPLKLRADAGSGYDPDLFYQRGRAIPINSSFPAFPQVTALASAESGDSSKLAALSVAYVVSRPYLQEDIASLQHQMLTPRGTGMPSTRRIPNVYPLLGLSTGRPQIVSIGQSPLGNGVFFGDSQTSPSFKPLAATPLGTNANAQWVDARLAFIRYPSLATRFGGVFTRSSSTLAIRQPASAVLAWTSGTLKDDSGRVIARASNDLQWHPLRRTARSLTCSGTCVVSAVGDPPAVAAEAAPLRPAPLTFAWITPWAARAVLPPHAESTLRWNTRYERSWTLLGTRSLQHVCLDQALNGWILPAGRGAGVYLINMSAAVQTLLETLCFICIILLLAKAARLA